MVIVVSVDETFCTGIGCAPAPGSRKTAIGSRKLAPMIVSICPPAGLRNTAGLTEVIVGAVDPGGVMMGAVTKVIVTALVTLLTVAVTTAVPASDEVNVAV